MGLRAIAIAAAVIAVTVAITAVAPSTAHAGSHPPMLENPAGCDYWVGTIDGNDKNVRLILVLCVDPKTGAVAGHAQWSSLVSGWNTREVTGTVAGTAYTLADVKLVESHPINGWRFCPIDKWSLTRSGDHLDGGYDSAACRDHAVVTLVRRVDDAAGSGAGSGSAAPTPAPPRPPPQPPAQPDPAPPPPKRPADRGCCAVTGASTAPDLATLALLALAVTAASRRRSGRGTRARRRSRAPR